VTITPEIIAAIASAIVLVLGAFFGFTKWIVNKFLHELKPNGGSSLKDQVNRLEKRVDEIYALLAKRRK
jgi:hypothetical protein